MAFYYYGQRSHRKRVLGGSYDDKVLSYGPTAYWPLWEASGTTAECLTSVSMNGTYTGVSLNNALGPDGANYAPLFDGTNDYIDIYTATFASAFDGDEGTAMIWIKVFNAGVWTDSTIRRILSLTASANTNEVWLQRHSGNNELRYKYEAGNAPEIVTTGGQSSTDWMHLAITWSAAADEVKCYLAGAQTGATQTELGTWAGAINSALTCIGADSTTPSNVFYGWLAHCAVWDSPLSGTAIADLAAV